VHDFVARWQGDLYHDMLFDSESLPPGTELWVSDYIENFSTFSSLELQQDYYNKTQVAIFITLVIRHREPNEAVLPSEVPLTLTLPLTLPYPTLPYPTLTIPYHRWHTSCPLTSRAMCMSSSRVTALTTVHLRCWHGRR
jgi:hypothetical protein